MLELKKTVIGSFPRICSSIDDSIRSIIDLQLRNNIDILSDGEQRYDMIGYFHQLQGLTKKQGKLNIVGKIQSIADVREFERIDDFCIASKYLKTLGKEVDIKIALTGPITLGMTCAINGIKSYYKNVMDMRIYEDLSHAMQPIITELLELGSLVQIDEPGLSGGFMNPEKAIRLINNLLEKSIKKEHWLNKLSIHTCGSIYGVSKLFDKLLDLNVSVLSLAFSGNKEKENIKSLSRKDIEKSSKKIGVGCVTTQINSISEIDSEEIILTRLREITRLINLENIAYVHPDCGLRNNSIDITEEILRKMNGSTNSFIKEFT